MPVQGKIVKLDKEARSLLSKGADLLTTAVTATLGPRSANVAINKDYPAPDVTHDGVTVAAVIRFKDPFMDMGAQLIKEAAARTDDGAGDGTTTATLLANTIFQEGLKYTEGELVNGVITPKINAMELAEKLESYTSKIISILEEKRQYIKTDEEIVLIASISAQSEEIGKRVAEAIKKVGKDGVIVVEESGTFDSDIQVAEGMEFENGWLSQYFVTDSDRMITEYEDAYILLTDYKIADAQALVPIIVKCMEENQPLLVIADDIVNPALMAMVATKLDVKTQAKVVGVMAPEFADRRKEMLEDLAVLTGGTVISHQLGMKLYDEVKLNQLGRARRIVVTQTHTTIIPKNPDAEEIQARVAHIQEQIANEQNTWKKDRLQERMAKLSGKSAIIQVGGVSLTEIENKKARYIDAVGAAKAALAEGIIPGGGVALNDIAGELENLDDTSVALDILLKALTAPINTIIQNSGVNPEPIIKDLEFGMGYDVISKKVVNTLKEGIIDPFRVTRLAVTYAISVAAMLLTTRVAITDEPEEVQKVRPVQ